MEKFSRAKKWILPIVIGLAVIGFVVVICVQSVTIRKYEDVKIAGTYISGDLHAPVATSEYLAFDREGTFYSYQQQNPHYMGTYEKVDSRIFSLTPENGEGVFQVIIIGDELYRLDGNQTTGYSKFSDTVVFLGIGGAFDGALSPGEGNDEITADAVALPE